MSITARVIRSWILLLLVCGFALSSCGGGADEPRGRVAHHKAGGGGPTPYPPQGPVDVTCPAFDSATPAALLNDPPPATTAPVGTMAGAFSVTSTGEATVSLPLVSVPGRAGIEPRLALVYDSNGGDSVLGMGFSIAGLS